MIYIIEGIDHIGKSTVISELMRRNPGLVFHSGMPSKAQIVHKPKYINKYCEDINDMNLVMAYNQYIYFYNMYLMLLYAPSKLNIYLDRFHLGEYVYFKYRIPVSETFNRETTFSEIDNFLTKMDDVRLILLNFRHKNSFETLRQSDENNKYGDKTILDDYSDFLNAYYMSKIRQKRIVTVDEAIDGNLLFKDPAYIADEIERDCIYSV